MQFTDMAFVLIFLPITLGLFHISNANIKPYVLFAFSLLFYALAQRDMLLGIVILTAANVIVCCTLCCTVAAIVRRLFLFASIAVNLSILLYFKYISTMFPIGLSFYVFKSLSLIIDVYRKKVTICKPIDLINHLVFFGQIQSGPITKYSTEWDGNCSFDDFSLGLSRFMMGFSKKVLLADVLVKVTSEIFAYDNPSTPYAWLGAICYSLQLYYDFSGYSDMAIGISRMFGVKCDENFNYPYTASTVSDFWRRWHMTLGGWFRDYVYIPLGGSRVAKGRVIVNLAIVWLLTGVWHGQSDGFIFWGISYFVIIAIERISQINEWISENRLVAVLYRIVTLVIVNFLWVVFYYGKLDSSIQFIMNMVIPQGYGSSVDRFFFLIMNYRCFILAAIFFSTPLCKYVGDYMQDKFFEKWYNIARLSINGILFVFAVSMVTAGANNPFLYVGF
ncbi:MAG: MBOAT family protein [Butyrivibrio sp.]|nr:MBOAT family protein [Butyrivibrio sp.]